MRQNWRSPGAMAMRGRMTPLTVKARSGASVSEPQRVGESSTCCSNPASVGAGEIEHGVAQDQDLLFHGADFGDVAVDAVDHDGSGHAVERLLIALAVGVGVIPVEAGRLVGRDDDGVLEALAGHGHHGEDIVLMGMGRDVEAVEVEVGHVAAGAVDAELAGVGGEVVLVDQVEDAAGRGSHDGRDLGAVVGEGGPAGGGVGDGAEDEGRAGFGESRQERAGSPGGLLGEQGSACKERGSGEQKRCALDCCQGMLPHGRWCLLSVGQLWPALLRLIAAIAGPWSLHY